MTGSERIISVDALARVEGEGALHVVIGDGEVADLELRIYEPPRFFEAFLRGRRHTEPPDICARICGICPVAYQMSACAALEAALGVRVDGALADLRRLLYCGEWIESHTLHIYLLHAPDFLGVDHVVGLGRQFPDALRRGLDLKRVGNRIVEVVGGRAVHPVNVAVGGFHRLPSAEELAGLAGELSRALQWAVETVEWVAGFEMPDSRVDLELLALSDPDRYAMLDGRLRSTGGLDLGPDELPAASMEVQVPHSTALHSLLGGDRPYLVGPLARYALNGEQLGPAAVAAARSAGLDPEERNPFRSIVVRAVEVVEAVATALEIVERWSPPPAPAMPAPARAGSGAGWSEAPRGLLWHRYELDDDGLVLDARIVPPTSQNQAGIEADLRRLVQQSIHLDDEALRARCEHAIRNYDPCISCATHFLDLTVERR